PMQARVLFLESFYGGSHRDFADGLIENSRHRIDLLTLPGAFWKWRIRAAALSFLRRIGDPGEYDLIVTTDLLNLADLAALLPQPLPPIMLYMHENQISYPLPPEDRIDYHLGFANITSALIADRIVFNSYFHLSTFLNTLPRFLDRIPDFDCAWVIHEIKRKSCFIYPGCSFGYGAADDGHIRGKRPLIVWNHRWEFDKNPDGFFGALAEIDEAGIDFDLAIMGECSQKVPKPFLAAKERYGSRVLVYGYVASRDEYYGWLRKGDIVISTALQENFGIAMVEATRMGCFPLLPSRLSYPEVLPQGFHGTCLYSSRKDLVQKLKKALSGALPAKVSGLPEAMNRYDWRNLIGMYDDLIESVCRKPA
ncbi:MAG: DUF3524 domain-containing protein, partial [Spirochaetales bacterium]|nr:DUF3524 domain-containing protein [Spirochaetales bacterium]